ncbi:hypothetical protein MACH18_12400 [Phaeobacter italicus]|uniref:KAP family P-loop NTPase fold protein n=1 Tax=Phaeobacter italicus TaxID=481446 RepID=UPI00274B8AB5|nr:P-loop NTPase fold protein [Phaeobacter italicus]GLO74160.1 hypothetical protein MACH18_12400 [Phaeobacter italicus]
MADLEKMNPWCGDLLGYEEIGKTYTNLIQSITDSKVISIEAGFGRGKTFFRQAWAAHLKRAGEVVIEIDAQQSDHSGDPVVTFLASLMETLEPAEQSKWAKAVGKGAGIAVGAAKVFASVAARKAGEEVVGAVEDWLKSDGEESNLDAVISEFCEQASSSLSAQLTAQIAAERVRTQEMPAQMMALRDALTSGKETDRVVILIDELDRCHPEYAIALLEAMKLVFNQDGFVFVLLVNAEHLERLAGHLFGVVTKDERYLDKFVDIRLRLPITDEVLGRAAYELVSALPFGEPFGPGEEFTIQRAAKLASELAPISGLSMRQIKRVCLKIELALRCYSSVPLDAPLLVFLAFDEAIGRGQLNDEYLPRVRLVQSVVDRLEQKEASSIAKHGRGGPLANGMEQFIRENCRELVGLPKDRYNLPDKRGYHDWAEVMFLARTYLKSHKAVLDSVHQLSAQ